MQRNALVVDQFNKIKKSIQSAKRPWDTLSQFEKFIIQHRAVINDDKKLKKQVDKYYQGVLEAFSDNLGEISRQLFLELDNYSNTLVDSNAPKSHQHCSNAANHLLEKCVYDILSKKNIDERTLTLWRYIKIMAMRFNAGDYHTAKTLMTALHSASISRLKSTFEGLPPEAKQVYEEIRHSLVYIEHYFIENRQGAIIPSLAHIKSRITAASQGVHGRALEVIQNENDAMVRVLKSEVRKVTPKKSTLAFFKFNDMIKGINFFRKLIPWQSNFDDKSYNLSIQVEPRGKVIETSDLFSGKNKVSFLNDNVQLQIDDVAKQYIEQREIERKKMELQETNSTVKRKLSQTIKKINEKSVILMESDEISILQNQLNQISNRHSFDIETAENIEKLQKYIDRLNNHAETYQALTESMMPNFYRMFNTGEIKARKFKNEKIQDQHEDKLSDTDELSSLSSIEDSADLASDEVSHSPSLRISDSVYSSEEPQEEELAKRLSECFSNESGSSIDQLSESIANDEDEVPHLLSTSRTLKLLAKTRKPEKVSAILMPIVESFETNTFAASGIKSENKSATASLDISSLIDKFGGGLKHSYRSQPVQLTPEVEGNKLTV